MFKKDALILFICVKDIIMISSKISCKSFSRLAYISELLINMS